MPKIIFDKRHINKEELEKHKDLIQKILTRSSCQSKMLENIKYNKQSVFRAKINEKDRLIFIPIIYEGEKSVFVLSINDHNYDNLKRQLESKTPPKIGTIEFIFQADPTPILINEPETIKDWNESIFYQQSLLFLDESQNKVLHTQAPLLLSGPPGSGKTVVTYQLMQQFMQQITFFDPESQSLPVLYISQSDHLIRSVKTLYQESQHKNNNPVEFSTWNALLQNEYPDHRLIETEDLHLWLKNAMEGTSTRVVHYEMSLIAALGKDRYRNLGKRQCYFSKNAAMQNKLFGIFEKWLNFLAENKLLDPKVMGLNKEHKQYAAIFFDEAQNISPVALNSLMPLAYNKQFFASLDTEQCLLSSPYIQNCLKELMSQHFKNYLEHHFYRTWRCAPEIIQVANHLIDVKYQLDAKNVRRDYVSIESNKELQTGLVSMIDKAHVHQLKSIGALPGTVVIATNIDEMVRARINAEVGSNNILTPKEAIGLDFDSVIIWEPFNDPYLKSLLKCKQHSGLNIEQLQAINGLYVSITRARSEVFIYEDLNHYRSLIKKVLGPLTENCFSIHSAPEASADEKKKQWEEQVKYHLENKNYSAARAILTYHLQMKNDEADAYIQPFMVQAPSSIVNTYNSLPTDSQKKIDVNPKPLRTMGINENQTAQKKSGKMGNKEIKETALDINKVAPVLDPATKYIKSLLTSVNKKTAKSDDLASKNKDLENLFSSRSLNSLLFEKMLDGGEFLFDQLLVSNQQKQFLQLINTHFEKIETKLTLQFLTSCRGYQNTRLQRTVIHQLALTLDGVAVLDKIMLRMNHEDQLNLIKTMLLPYIDVDDIANVHSTPFYMICWKSSKKLEKWFANNPLLIPIISQNLFLGDYNDPAPKHNVSPFYWLACDNSVGDILKKWFMSLKCPLEYAKALYAVPILQKGTNKSALYYLSINESGCSFLFQLFDDNPHLVNNLLEEVPESLTQFIYILNRIKKSNVLYFLAKNNSGVEILFKWFKNSKSFAKSITIEHLTHKYKNQTGEQDGTTLLYWLSSTVKGSSVLKEWLSYNPELASQVSLKHLMQFRHESEGVPGNTSPLYLLSKTEMGKFILNEYFKGNKSWAHGMTFEMLSKRVMDSENPDAFDSPFHNLCLHHSGVELLITWFSFNLKLAKEVTLEILRVSHNNNPIFVPLEVLPKSEIGRELLKLLATNNEKLRTPLTDLLEKDDKSEEQYYSKFFAPSKTTQIQEPQSEPQLI